MPDAVNFSPEETTPPVFRVSPLLKPQVDRLRKSPDEDKQVLGAILERLDLMGQELSWQTPVLSKTRSLAQYTNGRVGQHDLLISQIFEEIKLLKQQETNPVVRTTVFLKTYWLWIAAVMALCAFFIEPIMLGYWEGRFQNPGLTTPRVEFNVKQ